MSLDDVVIRAAVPGDRSAIWRIIAPAIRAGETYALPRDMSEADALFYWLGIDRQTFVAIRDGRIVGTYYLRPNQAGGGSHVANCGYMTDASQEGQGIARAMCAHSLRMARDTGFRAVQFNFVVVTNERAVALWRSMGFEVIGRQPEAFLHPVHGYVDALAMHRTLR